MSDDNLKELAVLFHSVGCPYWKRWSFWEQLPLTTEPTHWIKNSFDAKIMQRRKKERTGARIQETKWTTGIWVKKDRRKPQCHDSHCRRILCIFLEKHGGSFCFLFLGFFLVVCQVYLLLIYLYMYFKYFFRLQGLNLWVLNAGKTWCHWTITFS